MENGATGSSSRLLERQVAKMQSEGDQTPLLAPGAFSRPLPKKRENVLRMPALAPEPVVRKSLFAASDDEEAPVRGTEALSQPEREKTKPTPRRVEDVPMDSSGYQKQFRAMKKLEEKSKEAPSRAKPDRQSQKKSVAKGTGKIKTRQPRKEVPVAKKAARRQEKSAPPKPAAEEPPAPAPARKSDIADLISERLDTLDRLRATTESMYDILRVEAGAVEDLFKRILSSWQDDQRVWDDEKQVLQGRIDELTLTVENERQARAKAQMMLQYTQDEGTALVRQLSSVYGGKPVLEQQRLVQQQDAPVQLASRTTQPQEAASVSDRMLSEYRRVISVGVPTPTATPRMNLTASAISTPLSPGGGSNLPEKLFYALASRLQSEQNERLKTEEQAASILAAEEKTIAYLESKVQSLQRQVDSTGGEMGADPKEVPG